MKTLIKLVVVLIVLVIIAAAGAWVYIDSIAKAAIERGSTSALGVETKVSSASLSLLHGQLTLKGLDVANPNGFDSKHFLNLKDGDVAVTFSSLRQDIIEVPHLLLTDLDVNLEKKEGKANYQTILDNLKGSESDTKPAAKEGKRYIIKTLEIRNVKVHVNLLGAVGNVNVPIDEIKLENVGSDTGKGILLKDLAGVIVKAVFAAAADKGGGLIPADISADLNKGLAQLKSLDKLADVKSLGKNLGDIQKNIGDPIKSIGDKAKDALGGALGNDKKKKGSP